MTKHENGFFNHRAAPAAALDEGPMVLLAGAAGAAAAALGAAGALMDETEVPPPVEAGASSACAAGAQVASASRPIRAARRAVCDRIGVSLSSAYGVS